MAEVLHIDKHEISHTEVPERVKRVKISQGTINDIPSILKLFELCRFDGVPKLETMGGLHLVAKDEDSVVGYLWALIGDGTVGYIDFLCVHPDYRSRNIIHHTKVSLRLCEGMHSLLQGLGVTQFIGLVPTYKMELAKMYANFGMENWGKYIVVRKVDRSSDVKKESKMLNARRG